MVSHSGVLQGPKNASLTMHQKRRQDYVGQKDNINGKIKG
jgi:hypothetical protein